MCEHETKIVWDSEYEQYKCEKCGAFFAYNDAYRFCPFCARIIMREKIADGTEAENE